MSCFLHYRPLVIKPLVPIRSFSAARTAPVRTNASVKAIVPEKKNFRRCIGNLLSYPWAVCPALDIRSASSTRVPPMSTATTVAGSMG